MLTKYFWHPSHYFFKGSIFSTSFDLQTQQLLSKLHFTKYLSSFSFLNKNNLKIEDVEHLIFHPGGKKIVQIVEGLFHELGKNIDETKNVLREYGNMSSATVLYVLDRYLQKDIPAGDYGMMLSFGPGFSAQRLLLQWKK